MSKTQGAKLLLLQLLYLTYGVPQVKRPYRIGGHPMVIWMWCLPSMDDRDGGPIRADVSMFRSPTARIYIVCVLASRLLYWVRMFSGLGILVAPRLSTFRVDLGGISASTSSCLVKKSCLTLL